MRAVSNTTPLRYLIAIAQEHLFAQLFERVFVPVAVYEELTDTRTPQIVRGLMLSRPPWLEVRPVPENPASTFPVTLYRGERDAVTLAQTLPADVLLIDDHVGRTIALGRGIPISGTLGVLERADTVGLLRDFPAVLRQLKAAGFFITDALEQLLLDRHNTRRK